MNTGDVLAKAGQNASALEHSNQQSGHEASAFDVWTHSYDGMSARMREFADDPVGTLARTDRDLDRAVTAGLTGEWHSTSPAAVVDSIAAQAAGLGDAVQAIKDAKGPLATVGATFALLTGVEQMLSTLVSVIPFPALPAIRIMDMDVGLPHAHAHPPNLVPPAPPVPLPSTGPIIPIPIMSGATRTLINGMPAARCGDMGLGIWCGGYFPMYEVFLGSSSVWIEGQRAGRLAVDITKHCIFASPKPSDPPMGPMVGVTVMASGNVLIGGVPMPSLLSLALGAAMKALSKGLGKVIKGFSRVTAPLRRRIADALGLEAGFLRCAFLRAEPVNVATGEVVLSLEDFSLPGHLPMTWERHYGSFNGRLGVCGLGWTCLADARLDLKEDGVVVFYDGEGRTRLFPHMPTQSPADEVGGSARLVLEGNVLTVRLSSGLTYRFSPVTSVEALVTTVEDANGNYLHYLRGPNGLREIVESSGRRLEVTSVNGLVSTMHLLAAETETRRLLVQYEYSQQGELTAAYDALGHGYGFEYDNGRLIRHTDRNAFSFYYAYESKARNSRCSRSWGDRGLFAYTFSFNPIDRTVSITNSLGAQSSIQLDDRFLPIAEFDALEGMRRYEYDDSGRVTGLLDQAGLRAEYNYDSHGNPIRVVRPDGTVLTMQYDTRDHLLCLTDATGAEWRHEWDERGLLVARIDPLGARTQFLHDSRGNLVAATDPNGNVTQYRYDRYGNPSEIIDAAGNRSRFRYDNAGNLVTSSDPAGYLTTYDYDAKSRLIEVMRPGGGRETYAYDPEDNVVQYRDENGHTTKLQYFALGEVSRRIQPDGTSVQYTYDTELQLAAVTNERGDTYVIERDELGRVVKEIDYWGQSKKYVYAANGHLMRVEDGLGRTVRFVRDGLGREVEIALASGGSETLRYDANGRVVYSRRNEIITQVEFDPAGRRVKETQGDYVVSSSYDANGNRVERRTSDGNVVQYKFDSLNNPVAIAINDACEITMQRDARGKIIADRCDAGLWRDYAYDQLGRVVSREMHSGRGHSMRVAYSYDPVGNLTAIDHSLLGSERFAFDELGRVSSYSGRGGDAVRIVANPADTLAGAGASRGASTSPAELRIGEYGGTRYTLNANGEVIDRIDENASIHMDWDPRGQLLANTVRQGGDVAAVSKYEYDAVGRRVRKDIVVGDTSEVTEFGWDANTLVSERELPASINTRGEGNRTTPDGKADRTASATRGAGARHPLRHEYVYYPDSFEVLARIEPDGEVVIYHNDPNGAPREVTDRLGNLLWQARYTPQGAANTVVAKVHQPIRLQGQYADEESGLHYNRFRYFDPAARSYLTKDPLGLRAGEDLYTFGGNTLGWTDPLGLLCKYIRTWFRRNTAVGRLPRFAHRSRSYIERQLRAGGFVQSATDPNVWTHVDGSYVRIDPPHGLPAPGVPIRRSHTEPHVHKQWNDPSGARAYPPTYGATPEGGSSLDDTGRLNDDPGKTHIITRS